MFARKPFFDAYRAQFSAALTQPQVAGLETLLSFMEADQTEIITDLRWFAYMLATVKHECANTYQPITERGPKAYFAKYEPNTPIGKVLGNTQPDDGYLYRGRGYVQITGRTNYKRMTQTLGLDPAGRENLVLNPSSALRPDIAYRIMSVGMRLGLFTGRRLSRYISGERCDYKGARAIINSTDRAELIAGYATGFEKILRAAQVPPTIASS